MPTPSSLNPLGTREKWLGADSDRPIQPQSFTLVFQTQHLRLGLELFQDGFRNLGRRKT